MTYQQRNNNNDLEVYYLFDTIYTFNYKKQKRTFSQRHCPICYSYIRKNNVVLNCTHNCCFECFHVYIQKAYECRDFPICFICRKNIDELEIQDEINKKKIQDIPYKKYYREPKRALFHYHNVGHIFINKNTYVIIKWFLLFWLFYTAYDTTLQYIYCYFN